MSATVTLVANSFWTDFSARTEQALTPTSTIPVGDRAFLVLGSTVADTVFPPALASWGGIMSLTDSAGNVYTRDAITAGAGTTADATTTEIWSAYVKYPIASGVPLTLNVTPGTRGLSAWWKFFGVHSTAEAGDGSVSPVDRNVQADQTSGPTTWSTGTTGTLAQADELCIALHSIGAAPTAPWFTDTAGFTRLGSDQSGNSPGSLRGLSVLTRETAATTGLASTGTIAAGTVGMSCMATYKVAATPVTPTLDPIQLVQESHAQTAAGTTQAVTLPATATGNFMVAIASVWKSGGADPGATISDSGNTWTAAQATAPLTSGGARVYIWTAPITSGGSRTITVTANASAAISVQGTEWSGPAGATWAVDQKNKNSGSSASGTPGSVTVATANELYLAAGAEDAGTKFFNADNWSTLWDISTGQDLHVQWQRSVAGQTTNPVFAWLTSTTWAAQIITVKATAPVGTATTFRTLLGVGQ